jgi:hypothetical protein
LFVAKSATMARAAVSESYSGAAFPRSGSLSFDGPEYPQHITIFLLPK